MYSRTFDPARPSPLPSEAWHWVRSTGAVPTKSSYSPGMKARPDDFVVLVANEFGADAVDYIAATHAEFWQEELVIKLGDDVGQIELPEMTISLVADPPIPELVELTKTTREPFGGSDLALLERHTQIWRLIGSTQFAAWPLVRLASTFIESGASAVFLPGTRHLHSPRAVRHLAMAPAADALTNFFVSAFDGEGWMRTRGLTPFRMPEIETQIVDGHNAAYFRLMDVAAAMIANGRPFDEGAALTLGPHAHVLVAGPTGPLRDDLAINGSHGVQTLR